MARIPKSVLIRSIALFSSALVFWVGLAWSPYWLLLLLPSFLLKSAFAPSNGITSKDEREILLNHKIGHVSFFVTYALILILFISKYPTFQGGIPAPWALLLILPPCFYFFGDLALAKGLRKSGLTIGWVFGGFWLLFALAGHGFSIAGLIESAIGGGILLTTFLSLKWPAIGGSLFLLEGLFMVTLYLRSGLMTSVKLLMLVILALPLFLSALFILSETLQEQNNVH